MPPKSKEYLEYLNLINCNLLQIANRGRFKDCYTTPYIDKVYLVQNSNRFFDEFSIPRALNLKDAQKSISEFLDNNIPTPKILGMFKHKGSMVTVQEKAKGTMLFVNKPYSIEQTLSYNNEYFKLDKVATEEIVFQYNYAQQLVLTKSPQKHFDNFLQNLITARSLGYRIDSHAENFTYDPNIGFVFIDIPTTKSDTSFSKMSALNDFISILSSYYHNEDYIDGAYTQNTSKFILLHKEPQVKILQKAFTAAKNCGLQITYPDFMQIEKDVQYLVDKNNLISCLAPLEDLMLENYKIKR